MIFFISLHVYFISKPIIYLIFLYTSSFLNLRIFFHEISDEELNKYDEKEKLMNEALKDDDIPLEKWINFAKSDGGLVNGIYLTSFMSYVY